MPFFILKIAIWGTENKDFWGLIRASLAESSISVELGDKSLMKGNCSYMLNKSA